MLARGQAVERDDGRADFVRPGKEVHSLGLTPVHADQRDAGRPVAGADPPDRRSREREGGGGTGGRGLHRRAPAPPKARVGRRPSAAQRHRRIGFLEAAWRADTAAAVAGRSAAVVGWSAAVAGWSAAVAGRSGAVGSRTRAGAIAAASTATGNQRAREQQNTTPPREALH